MPDFLFQGTRERHILLRPHCPKALPWAWCRAHCAYNSDLWSVRRLLAKMWNTEILAPPSLRGAFMAAIQIPFFGRKPECQERLHDQEELDVLLLTPLCTTC